MFCKEIQSAIEVGTIKFDAPEKQIKIDDHPSPTNMVEVKDQDAKTRPKLSNSERAKHSGATDPKALVSASQLGGQGRYEQGEGSKKPRRCVTSQMMINKYRCRQEKEERLQREHARREEDNL